MQTASTRRWTGSSKDSGWARLPLGDSGRGRMVGGGRGLFRSGRYADGVNAAVDRIIERLGMGQAAGASAPDGRNFVERNSPEELERQRQAEARRQQEEDAARAASERMRLMDYGVAAVLVARS